MVAGDQGGKRDRGEERRSKGTAGRYGRRAMRSSGGEEGVGTGARRLRPTQIDSRYLTTVIILSLW